MLPSFQSFKNFIFINGFIILLSALQYEATMYTTSGNYLEFGTSYGLLILRNYLLMEFINYGTRNKLTISENNFTTKNNLELHGNVFIITAVETATHMYLKWYMIDTTLSSRLLFFIPISFLFEIILDFFHYIAHRTLHHPYLYAYIHKKHHAFTHPITIATFYHSPLDVFLSISLPTVISLWCIPSISLFEFYLLTTYKIFTEISGHTGKMLAPTGSFPQCIWLPKLFGIELYTENHDLHHSMNNCNYAKRFSLWDKVFCTFKEHTE